MIYDNDDDVSWREITEENTTISMEAEKELEKIDHLQIALGEQEVEIEKALNDGYQALETALKRVSRDEALIARLKQKQTALQALQQDCLLDKATLDKSKKKLYQVYYRNSNSCNIVHG